MFDSDRQNYYQILDVKPDATQIEIRQAYFRVKTAYAKNSAALYSLFDEQQSKHVLERLEVAYLVLSNDEKRKAYDQVHGLLNPDDISLYSQHSNDSNTFSFANEVNRTGNSKAIDAAHDAAHNVFGMSGSFEAFPSSQEQHADQKSNNPILPPGRHLLDVESEASSVNTPAFAETAAFHTITPPPFDVKKNYESRIGIVKRASLAPSNVDKLDQVIGAETEFRGSFFKQVRELRDLSLAQLSDFTKISSNHIASIENEAFEKLPALVYVRGFVWQIAKALKMPHEKATTAYIGHYKKTHIH